MICSQPLILTACITKHVEAICHSQKCEDSQIRLRPHPSQRPTAYLARCPQRRSDSQGPEENKGVSCSLATCQVFSSHMWPAAKVLKKTALELIQVTGFQTFEEQVLTKLCARPQHTKHRSGTAVVAGRRWAPTLLRLHGLPIHLTPTQVAGISKEQSLKVTPLSLHPIYWWEGAGNKTAEAASLGQAWSYRPPGSQPSTFPVWAGGESVRNGQVTKRHECSFQPPARTSSTVHFNGKSTNKEIFSQFLEETNRRDRV